LIVVDASVLTPALVDGGPDGNRARARLRGEQLAAPDLVDLEVTSALRARVGHGHVEPAAARTALVDLVALQMVRVPGRLLVARAWELRESVSAYDAAYVALAESMGVPLVTADARLGRAHGPACTVEVL
jgi:predicted nucleic acid-binding protein